ncbi:MAG: hypothetical protein Greene041619_729 [Candidatus Peregrinibacteria bacterium Greene0416_19]|nr:MAG: hypothetical protein Greene041619_729 [Candidatus Peregrinibacteria bacterium Greene0416_19]
MKLPLSPDGQPEDRKQSILSPFVPRTVRKLGYAAAFASALLLSATGTIYLIERDHRQKIEEVLRWTEKIAERMRSLSHRNVGLLEATKAAEECRILMGLIEDYERELLNLRNKKADPAVIEMTETRLQRLKQQLAEEWRTFQEKRTEVERMP